MTEFEIEILEFLGDHDGILPLSPESDEAEIRQLLKMSREDFVRAVDALEQSGNVMSGEGKIRLHVKETVSGARFRKKRKRR